MMLLFMKGHLATHRLQYLQHHCLCLLKKNQFHPLQSPIRKPSCITWGRSLLVLLGNQNNNNCTSTIKDLKKENNPSKDAVEVYLHGFSVLLFWSNVHFDGFYSFSFAVLIKHPLRWFFLSVKLNNRIYISGIIYW